jgi:hypothetical protein
MLAAQNIVIGEGGSELLEYLPDNLPIRRAKVSTEGLPTREEEYVRYDVRKGPNDIGV